jgi:nucleolar protein 56
MDGILVLGIDRLWCLDEQFTVLAEGALGQSIEAVAKAWDEIRQGKHSPSLAVFLKEVESKQVERLFVESPQLVELLTEIYQVKAVFYEDVRLWRRLREDFLSQGTEESRRQLHDAMLLITRQAVKEASEKRDQLIIQAMNGLDDIEKTLNLFSSRLREWYGLHYPEATQSVEAPVELATLIIQGGFREQISKMDDLMKRLPKQAVAALQSGKSMGADISQEDMVMIQTLAQQILTLQQVRKELEDYLDESMLEIAPNLRGLIGPLLGARLIELAGGIDKLARLPASTIQVLGAETALFRALKTGARPPKHGVIFQHTFIHSAPWWQRGKIARILAGKIAIAARIDLFSGEYHADQLKQSITSRIAEVRRKYPTPPKPSETRKPSTKPSKQVSYRRRTKRTVPKKRRKRSGRK